MTPPTRSPTKSNTKTCLRCGHEWDSRVAKPKECPHCKSYKWDQPIRPRRKARRA